jgi:hypothetical protein
VVLKVFLGMNSLTTPGTLRFFGVFLFSKIPPEIGHYVDKKNLLKGGAVICLQESLRN